MPLYSFSCERCEKKVELIVKYDERDGQVCIEQNCNGKLLRSAVETGVKQGKPAYQMQAVLGSGAHVKGHFGKTAKLGRR